MTTRLGKTPDKDQLFVIANGLVQNPANYTYANDIITFNQPLLSGTSVLAMYYDRQSYASSFQLDTIGDEIKTFGAITPGSGYSNGTYTNVPLKIILDLVVVLLQISVLAIGTNVVLNQAR